MEKIKNLFGQANLESFRFRMVLLSAALIYCQKVFVLGKEPSLKTYELVAFLLLLCLVREEILGAPRKFIQCLSFKPIFFLFLFMVIAPLPGIFFNFINEKRNEVVRLFPEFATSIRYNPYTGWITVWVGYLGCFAVLWTMTFSRKLFDAQRRVIQVFLIAGSIVAIYSLYALIGIRILGLPDFVPKFLDGRYFPPQKASRAMGFSAEGGSYVVIQTWVVMYLIFCKDLFSRRRQQFLLGLNVIVLALTFSSALVGVLGALFITGWIYGSPERRRKLVVVSAIVGALFFVIAWYSDSFWFVYYVLFEKIFNFFTVPAFINDSGAVRAYSAQIGLNTFLENPIFGLGANGSVVDAINQEWKIFSYNIPHEFSENPPIPQNSYSMVLAEMGITGFFVLAAFWMCFLKKALECSKVSPIAKVGFAGGLFTVFVYLSNAFPYAIFLWFNLGFFLNEWYFRWAIRAREGSTVDV